MTAASGSEPLVRLTQHGPVAELALDRPAALNAISTALATELVAACAELGRLVGSVPLRAAVLASTTSAPSAWAPTSRRGLASRMPTCWRSAH